MKPGPPKKASAGNGSRAEEGPPSEDFGDWRTKVCVFNGMAIPFNEKFCLSTTTMSMRRSQWQQKPNDAIDFFLPAGKNNDETGAEMKDCGWMKVACGKPIRMEQDR